MLRRSAASLQSFFVALSVRQQQFTRHLGALVRRVESEKRFVDVRSEDILTSAVTAIGKPAARLSASLARRRMIVCSDGQRYSRSRDEGKIINA
jgi:hypothetical protein